MFEITQVFPNFDTLCRAIGIIGFLIYTGGFFALSTGRMTCTQPAYFISVFLAAACVTVSLYADFNLSSLLIQIFYGSMAIFGAFRCYARSYKNHAA